MENNNDIISLESAIKIENIDNVLLKRRKGGILLSDYQIEVLKRNNINYEKYTNVRELLFDIEDILNENYDESLDNISSQLSELIYYNDTKKWEKILSHFYISFFFIWL